MSSMKTWMKNATTQEQEELARLVGISRNYLYVIASGKRNSVPIDVAEKIEEYSTNISKKSKGRLKKVSRADLCIICRRCPHAIKCLKLPGGEA